MMKIILAVTGLAFISVSWIITLNSAIDLWQWRPGPGKILAWGFLLIGFGIFLIALCIKGE